jgi:SAM-dependent methyltransferase
MKSVARFTDSTSLLREQYRDDSNLNARVALHARFSTNRYGFHRWAFDQFGLLPGAAVLEVGCGPGTLWAKNSERLPDALHVMLTDFSLGMLDAARRALRPLDFGPGLAAVDVQALPFAPATFDAVIANHMLYHVPDRPRAIGELRRVLRPGGRLYAATNGRKHMRELFEVAGQRLYSLEGFGLENGVAQLQASFSGVEVRRYDNELAITEAEPVLAYVRSIRPGETDPGDLERLLAAVEAAIAASGAFRVSTDAGMLIATP